ncbi:hypothetical protein Gpo141_00001966 [Globisporangium polare]
MATLPCSPEEDRERQVQQQPVLLLRTVSLGATYEVPVEAESDTRVDELLQETDELLRSLDPQFQSRAAADEPASLDISGSSNTLLSSATPPELRSVVKAQSRRNVSRDRLKAELEALRAQASALEHTLQVARHKQLAHWLTVASASPPMWEKIAKRQKRGREQAEAESKRLRTLLESQTKYIAGIESTLFKLRHLAQCQQPTTTVIANSSQTVRLESGDEGLFEMLLSELDATYLRLDEVFTSAGIYNLNIAKPSSSVTPRIEFQSHQNQNQLRSFIEMVDVKLSPFAFDLKTRVSWICSKRKNSMPRSVEYDKTDQRDDVVAGKFRVKRVYNGTEVYLHLYCTMKRFVLRDRVVCVWRALFNGGGGGHFPDSYVQETGWSMQMAADGGTGRGTVETSCAHLEPRRLSRAAPAQEDAQPLFVAVGADVMTNLVVDAYDDDMEEMHEMMENMLMEESLLVVH